MNEIRLTHRTPSEQQAYMEGYEAGKHDAVKTGKWSVDIDMERGFFDWRRFYCSNCGDWNVHGESEYCPKCGAKMVSSKEPDSDS